MIVLFSDFGLEGPYIGQVKAVLLKNAPEIPIVDLFADAPPFRIMEASFLLATYATAFPEGCVFICVVDPGVGGNREGLAAKIDGRWYVGPDNGLFEILSRRARDCEVYKITPMTASATFHGRDVFAPIAARLAQGCMDGLETASLTGFPDWPDELSAVVYVDRFGNLFTGLRAAAIPTTASLLINGNTALRARTFSDVPVGALFWYENSNGLAEIALNSGNAARQLGVQIGDAVTVNADGE